MARLAQEAKSQLERAAATIIPSLVHPPNKRAVVLEDVFDVVTYVTSSPGQTLEDFLTEQLESSCEPSEALSSVASTVDVLSLVTSAATNAMSWSSISSPQDLAAARQLGPAARASMDRALALVRDTIREKGGLVLNYGELCDAVVTQAMQQMQTIKGSSVAKQIKHGLQEELYAELGDVVLQDQLKMLEMASFEEFRKSLSQLKVSPLLPQEMKNAVSESIASFSKKTRCHGFQKGKTMLEYSSCENGICTHAQGLLCRTIVGSPSQWCLSSRPTKGCHGRLSLVVAKALW